MTDGKNFPLVIFIIAFCFSFFIFIGMTRYLILPFLLVSFCSSFLATVAQVSFRTIVPRHPVTRGESFQVQYILENAEKISDFSPPQFPGFRVVAGPNTYSGEKTTEDNKTIHYKNIVFTLAAEKEGTFNIYGASCLANGRVLKSDDVIVRVIAADEPGESSYFLKPGQDPLKKIRENLFLKLSVDKQTCFIGEPLVATFKLYSRLQSKSNIVKNPGFYGFSVYDMIEVEDKVQSEEKLNGRWFDVHTVRKLQLYPLQAGIFTIDPMELANKVEFSRSEVHKKTEQQVTENMYGTKNDEHSANTEEYETSIKSNPVVINVKPLPHKNSVDTFAGAVGKFSISAFVEKDSLLKNEEGSLTVDILGAGNFPRVNAPVIQWPKAIEVFDPSVKDTFDRQQVPLSGQREFKYIFVSDKPGFYLIPPISFSFFDIKGNSYKTVSSKPITIFISAKCRRDKLPPASPTSVLKSNGNSRVWLIPAGFLILIAAIVLWLASKRKNARKQQQKKLAETANHFVSLEKILAPARIALNEKDKIFYEELDRSIWNYFTHRLPQSNSGMIKRELSNILISKGVEPDLANKLVEIIHYCETCIYTNAAMDFNKTELLENTNKILSAIDILLI